MSQQKYEGPERRSWHLKKEISLGDLIAFTSAALAVVYAYTTLDKRITIIEQVAVVQKVTDEKQDTDFLRYQQRIDESLRDLNRKLDRLIEARR